MSDLTAPHADGDSSNGDAYLARLPEEDRATFARMNGETDLVDEIRLLRTIIASLLENLRENYRHFGVLFNVLARAVAHQIKGRGGTDDLEEAILRAADDALDALKTAPGPDESASTGAVND